MVILVPAVLYPLIDAAAHIVQSKRIWLKAANLDRLLGSCEVIAILTIGHAGLKLISPPVLCLRASTRCIFPFRFTWEPICFSHCAREPSDEELRIADLHWGRLRAALEGVAFLLARFRGVGLADPGNKAHGLDLKAMATDFAREYGNERARRKEVGAQAAEALPCINHPVFKGKLVNVDPRDGGGS